VEPVACRRLGDLAEEGLRVVANKIAQGAVALDLVEKGRCFHPVRPARHRAEGLNRQRAPEDHGHSDDAIVAHRGHLHDGAIQERRDQRDDAVEREVHGVDSPARLEEHGPDVDEDLTERARQAECLSLRERVKKLVSPGDAAVAVHLGLPRAAWRHVRRPLKRPLVVAPAPLDAVSRAVGYSRRTCASICVGASRQTASS